MFAPDAVHVRDQAAGVRGGVQIREPRDHLDGFADDRRIQGALRRRDDFREPFGFFLVEEICALTFEFFAHLRGDGRIRDHGLL